MKQVRPRGRIITNLKQEYINQVKEIDKNVFRGHISSLSVVGENEICLYLKSILGEKHKFYIDSTIPKKYSKAHKNIRPDILITDLNNNLKYVVEIKLNQGWSRTVDDEYVSKLQDDYKLFKKDGTISIDYFIYNDSNEDYYEHATIDISTSNKVRYLYIVLTAMNSKLEHHQYNYETLKKVGIEYYVLFNGWYHQLYEIEDQEYECMSIDKLEESLKYRC